jgi:hypothetical protein
MKVLTFYDVVGQPLRSAGRRAGALSPRAGACAACCGRLFGWHGLPRSS